MQERPFWQVLVFFLVLNFGALALGNVLQGEGPRSDWYQSLNKAPWTPPGWVFGAMWTTIMICFSIFMAKLVQIKGFASIAVLFLIQFVLNVSWNPVFFRFEQMGIALVIIISLAALVGYFLFAFRKEVKNYNLLMLPYFVWLLIATTLNAYALMNN